MRKYYPTKRADYKIVKIKFVNFKYWSKSVTHVIIYEKKMEGDLKLSFNNQLW